MLAWIAAVFAEVDHLEKKKYGIKPLREPESPVQNEPPTPPSTGSGFAHYIMQQRFDKVAERTMRSCESGSSSSACVSDFPPPSKVSGANSGN